jgi:hypothetical protein
LTMPARVALVTMALCLAPREPEAGPWRAEQLASIAAAAMLSGRGNGAVHRPVVLAVDGRSSSGKTTLAARLHDHVRGSAVVHTDDIAWWHSRFGWADLLIEGILTPARAGRPVSYRPLWPSGSRPTSVRPSAATSPG